MLAAVASSAGQKRLVITNHQPTVIDPPGLLALSSSYLTLREHATVALSSKDYLSAASRVIRKLPVDISVVMPVYNAFSVGLSIAMRDILSQRSCPCYEVVVCDDGSTDSGREYLIALSRSLGLRGACDLVGESGDSTSSVNGEAVAVIGNGDDEHSLGGRANSAAAPYASRRGKHGNEASLAAAAALAPGAVPVFPVRDVAAAVSQECWRLRVVSTKPGGRGQGAAMDASLGASNGRFVALMESDDTRPPHCLAALAAELKARQGHSSGSGSGSGNGVLLRTPMEATMHLVCSEIKLVVSETQSTGSSDAPGNGARSTSEWSGMQRYAKWQNCVRHPEDLARSRFIEVK